MNTRPGADVVAVIDNYDSFTYNLVQYLGELGAATAVYRNDAITVDELQALAPGALVISPGPCTPDVAGISVEVVRRMAETTPILGVCLGHQAVAQAYGGRVVRADLVMHGKPSLVHHGSAGAVRELPDPFPAMRYHSLVVERASLPPELEVTAWTDEGVVMGLRHRRLPVEGVQFHPESVGTPAGRELLGRFLADAGLRVAA